ncbi:uncharacterized protein LOC120403678 isoform X1 [Mauremys reevesii]|uniref:uncharacterized protein LOC120403678 isoform X1 n=2 Tax=Mauremys reevesii TaxID=260615 RepID=UPI00193F8F73|nr:uncharacterized protein LOC120403678 isoform X1 [Mauremys reevesii]
MTSCRDPGGPWMAEEAPKDPSKPIGAWEETKPPQWKSWQKSPQQKQELCVPQPFHADSPSYCNACLMRLDSEEKEALDYINAFLTSNEQDEAKKLKFLDSISTLSNLPAFMDKALLVEKIKELIDHESVDSLTGVMRQQAMLAIMKLSKMKLPLLVLTQPSLLTTCFSSIFSLPPAHTMEEVEAALYTKTLKTMDEMLKALVCEDQEPNLLVLQIILKVLLPWTTSREVHERLRAVGRIRWLMEFLGSQCKFQEVEEFRVLGQLVGCLTLCCVEQEQEIWQSAVEGLHHLFSFMQLLKSKMLVKHGAEYRQILKDSQTERAFWVTNISNITSAMLLLMQPNIPAYMTHRKMHWGSSKPDPSSLSGLLGASSEINAIKGIIASAYEHQPLLSTRECIRAAQYCAPVHCHAGLCHA